MIFRGLGIGWIGYIIAIYAVTDIVISFVTRAYLNSHPGHAAIVIFVGQFVSRVSILTRDININSVRPSVRDAPVSEENGLTYRHRLFTIR